MARENVRSIGPTRRQRNGSLPDPVITRAATPLNDLITDYIGRIRLNSDEVIKREGPSRGILLYEDLLRDDQVASALQSRTRAVVAKEWQVEPASESAGDVGIAAFVQRALYNFDFDGLKAVLLTGLILGYKATEILWTFRDGAIVPRQVIGIPSRRIVFDLEDRPRLLTLASPVEGEGLPERKIVVFRNPSPDGSPYGLALGKSLYWPCLFKKNAVKFWLTFADKFGSPTVVGKYPATASDDQKRVLMEALEAIQNESTVMLPERVTAELLEAQRAGRGDIYDRLLDYFDKAIAKVILGHTSTVEPTPGKLGNETLAEAVRFDYVKADADALSMCLNDSLIPWLVDYNFPAPAAYPKLWIRAEKEKDLKAQAERDKILFVDIGYPVSKRYIRDTYEVPVGEGDDALVRPEPKPAPMPAQIGQGAPPRDAQAFAEIDISPELRRAIEAQGDLDRTASAAVSRAVPLFGPILAVILAFLASAPDAKAVINGLGRLYGDIDGSPLAVSLQDALGRAKAIGASSVSTQFAEGEGEPFAEAVAFLRARAFTIAGLTKENILGEVKDALLAAMEKGTTMEQFRKDMPALFDRLGYTALNPSHIDLIYRMNMQSAYMAGRFSQMTDPAVTAARPFWKYSAVLDGRTRPAHRAMHGRIYRWDDPVWKTWYPPNGFNCRCTVYTVSASEMERNGWGVSPPLDASLSPDKGFGARGASLSDAYAAARRGDAGATWREAPNQSGPRDLGRPTEREIPASAWLSSPGKLPFLEELTGRYGLTEREAFQSVEQSYRAAVGMSPMETTAVILDPLGEAVAVDFSGIAHAMLNRADRRERYISYLRPTIEDPYEVLLTEYVSGVREGTKYRKKYIGLFQDEQKESVVIVGEMRNNGTILWTIMNAKTGTLDRQRHGRMVLYGG